LGNYEAATNIDILKRFSISSVLTVAESTGICYSKYLIKHHKIIPALDVEYYNLEKDFEEAITFINYARKFGNVLVHCFAGISRSASIVIAYLMKTEKMSYEEALRLCERKRDITCPNDGFIKQLKNYERTLNQRGNMDNLLSMRKQTSLSFYQKKETNDDPLERASKRERLNTSTFGSNYNRNSSGVSEKNRTYLYQTPQKYEPKVL
jgi:hypothetical protein